MLMMLCTCLHEKKSVERDIGNKTKHMQWCTIHNLASLSHTRSSHRTAFICYLWVLFRFAYKFHNWSKLTCSSSFHYDISHMRAPFQTQHCENFAFFLFILKFSVSNLFFSWFSSKNKFIHFFLTKILRFIFRLSCDFDIFLMQKNTHNAQHHSRSSASLARRISFKNGEYIE